jgi:hypothetical protein
MQIGKHSGLMKPDGVSENDVSIPMATDRIDVEKSAPEWPAIRKLMIPNPGYAVSVRTGLEQSVEENTLTIDNT